MWTKSFSRYTRILLVSAAVIIGSPDQHLTF